MKFVLSFLLNERVSKIEGITREFPFKTEKIMNLDNEKKIKKPKIKNLVDWDSPRKLR